MKSRTYKNGLIKQEHVLTLYRWRSYATAVKSYGVIALVNCMCIFLAIAITSIMHTAGYPDLLRFLVIQSTYTQVQLLS